MESSEPRFEDPVDLDRRTEFNHPIAECAGVLVKPFAISLLFSILSSQVCSHTCSASQHAWPMVHAQ